MKSAVIWMIWLIFHGIIPTFITLIQQMLTLMFWLMSLIIMMTGMCVFVSIVTGIYLESWGIVLRNQVGMC